jgi:hypothetical protein
MVFSSGTVINQQISSATIRTFFVGYDLGEYRNEPFTEILLDTIVDFAFGYHTGILQKYDRRMLKEAARSIYKIKEYQEVKWVYVDKDEELSDCELKNEQKFLKRGEFGEMILHLILRDFFNTVPLLAKVHFKDTDSSTIHGFDIVHIGPDIGDPNKESLFFGESKLYSRKDGQAGIHGITDLLNDVKDHFKKDFLYREFALISKKKDAFKAIEEYEDRNTLEEYSAFLERKKVWYERLSFVEAGKMKLEDLFKSVTIPVICTYQSKIFENKINENSAEFQDELSKEVGLLSTMFNSSISAMRAEVGELIRTNLNVVLLLFPIPSKKQLIKSLHEKLYKYQA